MSITSSPVAARIGPSDLRPLLWERETYYAHSGCWFKIKHPIQQHLVYLFYCINISKKQPVEIDFSTILSQRVTLHRFPAVSGACPARRSRWRWRDSNVLYAQRQWNSARATNRLLDCCETLYHRHNNNNNIGKWSHPGPRCETSMGPTPFDAHPWNEISAVQTAPPAHFTARHSVNIVSCATYAS